MGNKITASAIRPNRSYTYMVFSKKGRGLKLIIGPIFGSEIERIKQQFFSDTQTVHVLEETVFISRYQEHYLNHMKTGGWMDRLYTYFVKNAEWIGNVNLDVQAKGFSNGWFTMFEVIFNNERMLQIQFIVNSNKFHTARLLLELQQQLPFKLLPKEDYYPGTDQMLYTGFRAVQRSLAEGLVRNMCLS